MFKNTKVFSSFSVSDLAAAKKFYQDILELDVTDEGEMGLNIRFNSGHSIFIYPKENHIPASFTVLNLIVDDIDSVATDLKEKGITFEHYDNMHQGEDGIARGISANMGPDIAWFKDPSGNIISVLQEKP